MMTGELFEIEGNILKVVSLDGHRISIRKIELKENYAQKKVIVPGKTLQEISKIIGGEAEALVDISQRIISYLNLTKQLLYLV